MNINWSTVFFQIINFLLIIWILKKYLFKPVLMSMDKREKAIQSRLKDAEEAKILTEKERENLKAKIAQIEKMKNDVLAEAYKKADNEQAILIKTLKAEIQGKRIANDEQMRQEREALKSSIKDIAGETIINTVSSALSDLANVNIQNVILENFTQRLFSGEIEKIDELKKFYREFQHITINTSFDLDMEEENRIKEALTKLLGEEVNIDFRVDKSILCGIEVVCESLLISFGMNTYIKALKVNLDNKIAELTKTEEPVDANDE